MKNDFDSRPSQESKSFWGMSKSTGGFFTRFPNKLEIFESTGNEFIEFRVMGDEDDVDVIAYKAAVEYRIRRWQSSF